MCHGDVRRKERRWDKEKVLMLDTFFLDRLSGWVSIRVVVGLCPRTGCDLVREEASLWTETKDALLCVKLSDPKHWGLSTEKYRYLTSECFGSTLNGHQRLTGQNNHIYHFHCVFLQSASQSSHWEAWNLYERMPQMTFSSLADNKFIRKRNVFWFLVGQNDIQRHIKIMFFRLTDIAIAIWRLTFIGLTIFTPGFHGKKI